MEYANNIRNGWRKIVRENIRLLREPTRFAKFCSKNDKVFGCRQAFACYVSCPLWMAREVEFLVNEKGMTIGEAHRACMREHIFEKDKKAIIKETVKSAMDGEKPDYTLDGDSTEAKKDE